MSNIIEKIRGKARENDLIDTDIWMSISTTSELLKEARGESGEIRQVAGGYIEVTLWEEEECLELDMSSKLFHEESDNMHFTRIHSWNGIFSANHARYCVIIEWLVVTRIVKEWHACHSFILLTKCIKLL